MGCELIAIAESTAQVGGFRATLNSLGWQWVLALVLLGNVGSQSEAVPTAGKIGSELGGRENKWTLIDLS